MEKPKITIVTLSFEGGGAEKVLLNIIMRLADHFKFQVITFYDKGIYLDEIKTMPHVSYECIHAEKGNTISFAWRIRKIIKKAKPSKVMSFLYYPNIVTYLSLLGTKFPHFPSERSNHQKYLTNSLKHKIWKKLLLLTYIKADKIITVSEASKLLIHQDFKISNEKLVTIYNGISFHSLDILQTDEQIDYTLDSNLIYMVAVGNLYPAKNYSFLIESFQRFYHSHPNARLLIIGKGIQESELTKLVIELNLIDKVIFLGFIKNPHALVKKSTCFILSSKFEGFPNSLLEGMYVNGHVISTDCPTGPSEIITNMKDGILCTPANHQEMVLAMEKMCFDLEFRKSVFDNSRIKIKKFDIDLMITKYLNLLSN